jgi:hypothetical protein
LSVSHAEAVVGVFDEQFPTPKQVKDVAFNLRQKYAPPEPSQREKWEAEYGPPDSAFYENLHREAGRIEHKGGYEDEQMWRAIKRKLMVTSFANVPWGRIYSSKRELGFPLGRFEREQADAWDQKHTKKEPATEGPITQADIDQELAKRAVNGPREVLIKLPPDEDPAAQRLQALDDGYLTGNDRRTGVYYDGDENWNPQDEE